MTAQHLADSLFALSHDVRYVALRSGNAIELHERPGLVHASSSESDRYEELLVNPTLLTLVRERGQIDCGGLEFVIIRYGNFFQVVHPVTGGHVSVAVEPTGDPLGLVDPMRDVLARHHLWPVA